MFHEVIRVYQVGFSHAIVYSSLPKSEHESSIQQRILDNAAESEVIYIKSCSLETSHGAIISLIVILKHYAVFHSFLHNSIMLFCGGLLHIMLGRYAVSSQPPNVAIMLFTVLRICEYCAGWIVLYRLAQCLQRQVPSI